MTREPSRYVQPEVSDTRVNRLWGNVSARLEARPARFWRWVVLCTALSGVAAAAVVVAKTEVGPSAAAERAVLAEAKLETASDSLAVTLVDGSKLSLASRTEVQVRGNQPSAVALSLSRGEVMCDVTHREERKFTVVAGDVEVRVVGTKFSVKATPGGNPRVEVSVLRGVVEVRSLRRPGIVARVAAGQSWIQNPEPSVLSPSGVARAEPAPAVPEPSVAEGESDAKRDAKAAASGSSASASGPSARELFEKAGESRRAGDAASAAQAYEELLRLHPSDGRASLSAFELGRLRMDRLADPAGAIAALERAVALNIGPSFREDALARLVSVYASQGNFAACARARDRYLSSYPAGVHASALASRCGSR
jgi:TolA-binding protein